MAQGLADSDVVTVQVNMTPQPVALRNFGVLLIAGPTDVIDIGERIREYAMLDEVAADFGTTAPEYLAADLFFSQNPQPAVLDIGRWAKTATSGILKGAILSATQQSALLTTLQGITNGGLRVTVDGTVRTVTGLNFSAISNLNGAAALINGALTGATCTFAPDSNTRFVIKSTTTGTASTVSYAQSPGTGTDISGSLGLTQATGASVPVNGSNVETPLQAVQAFDSGASLFSSWYGLMFADASISGPQHLAVAGYIEGAAQSHIYGITTQEPAAIDGTQVTDIGAQLQSLHYMRTFTQYSSSSPYAVASIFGRAFTVDFSANNTTITLKFKQEPGVVAETLTESQAAALKAKNINVFVNYNNGAAIIQEGVMANGYFFDEVHGTDWLQNNIQTGLFNALYTTPTKIPQTDAGINILSTAVEAALYDGVNNGLIAPGQWNAPGFGQLKQGQTLPKGYYVYAPAIASQNQADRAERKAPTLQCAIKLAGAVHFANVLVNVNR